MTAGPTKDPVCGREVDPLRARAVGIFGGVTYYFCSQDCKTKFVDPRHAPRDGTRDVATKPKDKKGKTLAPPPPVADRAEKKARDATDSMQFKSEPSAEAIAAYEADGEEDRESRSWGRIWMVILVLMAGAAA